MIRAFIDTLYAIAIGLGFDNFPDNPLDSIPSVILFLMTLTLAASDWYYYRGFEDAIEPNKKKAYYTIQVLTVLVLSQLFAHSTNDDPSLWIGYLIAFVLLGTIWNLVVPLYSRWGFVVANLLIIASNLVLLLGHESIIQALSITDAESFLWIVIATEAALIAVYLVVVNIGVRLSGLNKRDASAHSK